MNESDMPIIEATCRSCHEVTQITVTRTQLIALTAPGRRAFIQDILPDHTPNEREMFMSGLCGKCFDKLWGEEEPYEPQDAMCDRCGAIFREDQLEPVPHGDETWFICPVCANE